MIWVVSKLNKQTNIDVCPSTAQEAKPLQSWADTCGIDDRQGPFQLVIVIVINIYTYRDQYYASHGIPWDTLRK